MPPLSLAETLNAHAAGLGFSASGSLDYDSKLLEQPIQTYDEWLASGFAGEMNYLARGRDRRAEPSLVFPEIQSVFCVAWPYSTRAPDGDGHNFPRYARYLQGTDYHALIQEKLEELLKKTRATHPDLTWKICVDTSAVLERSWSALAGLGWIGKNGMLIHPKHGSYFFIGVVYLSQPVHRGPSPLHSLCGNCTRCLTACPTQAIVREQVIDSNRCISYLTLEKRGPHALDPATEKALGTWVAGCDLCQEVCPFNFKRVKQEEALPPPAQSAALETRWSVLLEESEEDYRRRVRGSSLKRIKYADFRRNLNQALLNSGDSTEVASRSTMPE